MTQTYNPPIRNIEFAVFAVLSFVAALSKAQQSSAMKSAITN